MGVSAAVAVLLAASQLGATIPIGDVHEQEQAFRKHWGTEFSWQFDELPDRGKVANHQTPFSGYIYPDNSGGTMRAMRKYDSAFHHGQSLAASFEEWDTQAYKTKVDRQGPLGMVWGKKMAVPNWSGHCNGWAAAAIRHAEPQTSVRVNNVVFTPSDIKAMLAELYIYNDIQDLSGSGGYVNAGIFHAVLSNWLGRGGHGLGMESEPGEEKWNYPIYAFNSSAAKRAGRQVEVKLNLAYLKDSNGEYDESPRLYRVKYFHYMLSLDSSGRIIGGRYFPDSLTVDMLWLPLQPKEGRRPGNESGNPHLSVKNVLAIWRASVPEEDRRKWVVVDPVAEDRTVDLAHVKTLVPLGYAQADLPAPPQGTPSLTRAPAARMTDRWAAPSEPAASPLSLSEQSDVAQEPPIEVEESLAEAQSAAVPLAASGESTDEPSVGTSSEAAPAPADADEPESEMDAWFDGESMEDTTIDFYED